MCYLISCNNFCNSSQQSSGYKKKQKKNRKEKYNRLDEDNKENHFKNSIPQN